MRGRESRWARAAPWRERGRSEREHGKKKGGLHSDGKHIPRREGWQARRAFIGDVKVSKGSPGRSAEFGFTPSLAKREMGKEVGRRRARS